MSEFRGSAWASRLRRPSWTDPRLLIGLVLVAVATAAGSRVVATADDSVPVWTAAGSVQAGDPVLADELRATPVRIGAGGDAGPYLSADAAPPAGVFTRDLAAGELIPAGAVAAEAASDGVDLSLSVDLGDAPADLSAGDLVDVWAVPAEAGGPVDEQPAERVLQAKPVLSVTEPAVTLGGTARQVLLRIDEQPGLLAEPLSRLAGGRVVLVRVGG